MPTVSSANWTVWLGWIVVTTTAGAIVGALEGGPLQFAATVLLTAPAIATAQWLILRHYLQQASGWILATGAGWILGMLIQIQFGGSLSAITNTLWSAGGLWEVFWLNGVKQAVSGGVLGIAQWLILRRHLQQTGWWIIASTIAGSLSGFVSATVCAAVCQTLVFLAGGAVATAVTYGAGWAANSAVTGGVLLWLLRHQRQSSRI